jgi:hypothetical protein
MEITVWMAGWQMECCGTPFAVGSKVSWHLLPDSDVSWLEPVVQVTVDAVEDHHGGTDAPPTTATVVSIATVHYRCDPAPVVGSAVTKPVHSALKWNDDLDGRRFAGFLVRLHTPEPSEDTAV